MRSVNTEIGRTPGKAKRGRGRPRSERARRAVLSAAFQLAAKQEAKDMTMEAIALKAGVSKETLYRWWSSKGSVLLDALAQRGEEEIPIPEGASFHEELGEFMRATARTLDRPTRQALRNLAAEAAKDANFAKEMRMRFLNRRRAALQGILNRAVDRAELNPKRVELVLDLVFGSLWYRLIFGIAPLDRRWADEVTATISGCDVKHT